MKLDIKVSQLDEAARFALRLANSDDPSRERNDRLTEYKIAEPLLRTFLPSGEDVMPLAGEVTGFRDLLRKNLLLTARGSEASAAFESTLSECLTVQWRASRGPAKDAIIGFSPNGSAIEQVHAWAALGYFAILEKDRQRFKICQAVPCEELYFDETKPGRQRFCCKRCANRFNVAQYRSRLSGNDNNRGRTEG